MKRITLRLDDVTAKTAQAYAERRQTTLSALVKEHFLKTVLADRDGAVREMWRLMDAHPGRAARQGWTREELYAP